MDEVVSSPLKFKIHSFAFFIFHSVCINLQEQCIVQTVMYVLRVMIITVLGWEFVLENKIIRHS